MGFLTLPNPSYFGPTLYTKEGGHLDPLLSHQHLIVPGENYHSSWLYKPQILQGIRYILQGLKKHKVCKISFV